MQFKNPGPPRQKRERGRQERGREREEGRERKSERTRANEPARERWKEEEK